MRAFLAVDVVLVLVLVVLLATRGGGEDPELAVEAPESAASESVASASSGQDAPDSDAEPEVSASPHGSESGDPDAPRLFASPSGNIVCSIAEDAASCSIAVLSDEGLVEDETCDGTVGHVVRVTAEGGAERPCVEGDPPGEAPAATPVLDYEDSTAAFGYTCTSSRSGIICRHDETGHGFSIARAGSSLF